MALTATLSAVVSSATSSSNKPRIDDKERSNGGRITTRLAAASEDKGRRGLLLSSVLLASQLNDSQAQLLQSIYIYTHTLIISLLKVLGFIYNMLIDSML